MAKSFSGLGATICDAAADLPSSPIEGLIVFQKDTNELKIYDGASWIVMLDTDNPPALQLVRPTSVTGGTINANGSVDFSGVSVLRLNGIFNSDFNNYKVICNHVGSSATFNNMRLRLSSGGTDYDNNYYNFMLYWDGVTYATAANANTTYCEWMYTANLNGTFDMDIFSPYLTTYTSMFWEHDAWGTTNNIKGTTKSWQYAARSYDGFSITPTGQTFSGNIRVYGYRK